MRCFAFILLSVSLALPAAVKESVEGPVRAKSLSKLTFAPDGTLFVGDSIGARIFALDLGDTAKVDSPAALEVADLEGKVAARLGVDTKDALIHDLAVNPVSKSVYLTASRGKRAFSKPFQLPNDIANASVLLRVTAKGDLEEVRLDRVKHTSLDIANPIAEGKAAASWKKGESERADVISDMHFIDGKLYVAGLSNEEFASALRIYAYPFDSSPGSAMQLEIFHGAHGKWETESPIRAFLPYTINGKRHLIASYLCTPFVLFPIDTLHDKARVKGTTIAELGAGNFPVDMVAFRSGGEEHVMVVNSTRGLMSITAKELAKPHPAIVKETGPWTGARFEQVRGQGILAAENFGDKQLLVLQRDVFTGLVKLSTWPLRP